MVSEAEVEVTGENDGHVLAGELFESQPHCADLWQVGHQIWSKKHSMSSVDVLGLM
jgi:hypothetical protein